MAACGERGTKCCEVEILTWRNAGRLRSSESREGSVRLKCKAILSKVHLDSPHLLAKATPDSIARCLRSVCSFGELFVKV